jgi:predicted transposase/invertase (TIGR01784 family)
MAVDTLVNVTQDEIEYARMSNLIKSEMDWNTGIIEATQKGLKEGRNEGIIEGRKETSLEHARKMKAMGFLAEQIEAVTNLSTETIAQL